MSFSDVPKGLQLINIVTGSGAIGTLAAATALSLNQLTGITRPFLAKRLRVNAGVFGLTADEPLILCIGRDSATITEIKDAIENANLDPEDDQTYVTDQAGKSAIFWETVRMVSSLELHYEIDISMFGGKGCPLQEDDGLTVYAYNPRSFAMTTGGQYIGSVHALGVWM